MLRAGTIIRERLPSELIERIRRIELGRRGETPCRAVASGWASLDAALPHRGLLRGATHEWLGVAESAERSGPWRPCLTLLVHWAASALRDAGDRCVVWIGEAVWPYGHALLESEHRRDAGATTGDGRRALLDRSLFIAAPGAAERQWATELALRCPALAAVVADASGLDPVASRRLQLAAEAGDALGLLARPVSEARELSAAMTRWLVRRAPSPGEPQQWSVQLLRCKGVQPAAGAPREWTAERDHATRAVGVFPVVVHRPCTAQILENAG